MSPGEGGRGTRIATTVTRSLPRNDRRGRQGRSEAEGAPAGDGGCIAGTTIGRPLVRPAPVFAGGASPSSTGAGTVGRRGRRPLHGNPGPRRRGGACPRPFCRTRAFIDGRFVNRPYGRRRSPPQGPGRGLPSGPPCLPNRIPCLPGPAFPCGPKNCIFRAVQAGKDMV